jgi:hypothetical protein
MPIERWEGDAKMPTDSGAGEAKTSAEKITRITIPEEEQQKMKEEKRRSPNVVEIERGGNKEIIPANQVVKEIEKDGVTVNVEAGSAEHIYAMHLSPNAPPGSQFEGVKSIDELTEKIRDNFDFTQIQEALTKGTGPLEEKKFVETIDIGEKMKTGVATLKEAAEKLGVTSEEIEEYQKHVTEIIALNREGDEEKKKAFIDSYNASHLDSKIYLSQRFPTAPITPFFNGEPIDTTELAVVIVDSKLVTTMPGHHREKLPFSPQGVWEHASDEEKKKLVDQFGSEEEAIKRIEADFEVNARDWTNAGFIKKR